MLTFSDSYDMFHCSCSLIRSVILLMELKPFIYHVVCLNCHKENGIIQNITHLVQFGHRCHFHTTT